MTRISFAPELSATFSRVSCWTIRYLAFSTISSTRHRFSLEMGRVSVMRTRSPTPHSFFSSWTLKRVRCCTVLRYRRCAFDEPTWTMTVLFILSEMTVPRRTLRRPSAAASRARLPRGREARRPSSRAPALSRGDKARLDRQLRRRELHRLFGDLRRHAAHLEQHAPGLDHRDPALRISLARTHPGLRGFLGDRLVREDADPDLAAALDVPGHRTPGGFDLPVAHPARFHRLQAVVAERHRGAARGDALATAAVHLAVLDALGDQHQLSAFFVLRVVPAFFVAAGGA